MGIINEQLIALWDKASPPVVFYPTSNHKVITGIKTRLREKLGHGGFATDNNLIAPCRFDVLYSLILKLRKGLYKSKTQGRRN